MEKGMMMDVSCLIFIIFCITSLTTAGPRYIPKGRAAVGAGDPDPFVVGGADAAVGEWPWQGSLLMRDPWTENWRHICGAVLIKREYVLTAAHCVDPARLSDYVVVLGFHDWENVPDASDRIVSPIREGAYIVHEEFDPDSEVNDIALIKIDRSPGDADIQHINLPTSDMEFAGLNCWITGWGQTENPVLPSILQKAETPVLHQSTCRREFATTKCSGTIRDTHICAGGINSTPTACHGDSGGPLSCSRDSGATWYLAGVYSWSNSFAGVGACDCPSVFTRVTKYLDWINSHVST